MTYIVKTQGLTKKMKSKILVDSLDMHVKQGEIYGFLGPNGAGKSSVMKMLTGIWKPDSGMIELFGTPFSKGNSSILGRIGSMIEFPAFYEDLTGAQNLKLHCEYMGYQHPSCIEDSLKLLDLTGAANQKVNEYSLGMRQRLGIARSILTKPELLILDEPYNGLDPSGMKEIRDLLKMLSDEYGITVIISSHILSEVEHLADTIGIIYRGNMADELSMKEIAEKSLAYLELKTSDSIRAAWILSDQMHVSNFKQMDDGILRIYDSGISSSEIARQFTKHQVKIQGLSEIRESLEDYFLSITGEQREMGERQIW